jgi:hypothetical protein
MLEAGVNKFKSMEQIRAEASKIVQERNKRKAQIIDEGKIKDPPPISSKIEAAQAKALNGMSSLSIHAQPMIIDSMPQPFETMKQQNQSKKPMTEL